MANAKALKFFDCNCAFGPYRTRVFRFARTADELIAEMDFSNIAQALFTTRPCASTTRGPSAMNGSWTRQEDIPVSFPPGPSSPARRGNSRPSKTLLHDMRRQGVRALRLFVDDHRYFLERPHLGRQMAVFMERRIPLFIRASLDRIATLLRSFPNLVVVTGSQGSNPLDRYAWPLIEKYPNLLFETSSYLVDGGIEEFCKRYSSNRLIFGSGFPDNAGGAAMLMLAHAEISDAEPASHRLGQPGAAPGGGIPAMNPSPIAREYLEQGIRPRAPSSTCTGTWARSTAVTCRPRPWSACATASSAAGYGGSSARTTRPWPATPSAAMPSCKK